MMDKMHFKQGDYVEKLCGCRISTLVFINMKHTLQLITDSPSYIEFSICIQVLEYLLKDTVLAVRHTVWTAFEMHLLTREVKTLQNTIKYTDHTALLHSPQNKIG